MTKGRRYQQKKSVPVLDYDADKRVAFSRRFGSKLRKDEAADFQRLANFFATSRYVVLHMMIKYCKKTLTTPSADESFAEFMLHNNYDLVVIPEAMESEQEQMLTYIEHMYGISKAEIRRMAAQMQIERKQTPSTTVAAAAPTTTKEKEKEVK